MASALIIYGAGGHAAVVADAVRAGMDWTVAGFLDDDSLRTGEAYYGATIIGTRHDIVKLGIGRWIFGFGNCDRRRAAALDLPAATVVHPSAIVSPSATLEPGVFIGPGAIVNARAHLESHVIVNSGAIVEHDCRIGVASHICPGVRLAGNVRIGAAVWIGIGSTIRETITIGDNACLGAGSVVVHNIDAQAVAYGVPARVVRTRTALGS